MEEQLKLFGGTLGGGMDEFVSYGNPILGKSRANLVQQLSQSIAKNKECYVCFWMLQNMDKNIDHYTLVHGFEDNMYTFRMEKK